FVFIPFRIPAQRTTCGPPEANPPSGSACLEEREDGDDAAMKVFGDGNLKLAEDVPDVLLDSAFAHPECLRDRRIRASLCYELHHLALTRRERLQRVRPRESGD